MASSLLQTPNHTPQEWDQLPNCFWQEARPDLDKHKEIYAVLVLLQDCVTRLQFMLVYLDVKDGSEPVLSRTTIVSAQPFDDENRHARLHVQLSPEAEALVLQELKTERTIAVKNPRNPVPEVKYFATCYRAAA